MKYESVKKLDLVTEKIIFRLTKVNRNKNKYSTKVMFEFDTD